MGSPGKAFHESEHVALVRRLARDPANADLLAGVLLDAKAIHNALERPNEALDEGFLKVVKFEIENPSHVKVHDQKTFLFHYKLSSKIRFERSRFFVELRYPSSRLCVLGEVRFALNDFTEEDLQMEGGLIRRRLRGAGVFAGVLLRADQKRLPGFPRNESR